MCVFFYTFTDTDSFIYEVQTGCFYNDMKKDLSLYDTSDYPSINIFNMPRVHKKIPGLFKDEMNSRIITEFVGLRSKMYGINSIDVNDSNKEKQIDETKVIKCRQRQ